MKTHQLVGIKNHDIQAMCQRFYEFFIKSSNQFKFQMITLSPDPFVHTQNKEQNVRIKLVSDLYSSHQDDL